MVQPEQQNGIPKIASIPTSSSSDSFEHVSGNEHSIHTTVTLDRETSPHPAVALDPETSPSSAMASDPELSPHSVVNLHSPEAPTPLQLSSSNSVWASVPLPDSSATPELDNHVNPALLGPELSESNLKTTIVCSKALAAPEPTLHATTNLPPVAVTLASPVLTRESIEFSAYTQPQPVRFRKPQPKLSETDSAESSPKEKQNCLTMFYTKIKRFVCCRANSNSQDSDNTPSNYVEMGNMPK